MENKYKWNMYYGANTETRRLAKKLREEITPAEALLWEFLRNRNTGFKFRRQHPLSIYVADFYCHELKLVIEVDGSVHDEINQKMHDESRTNNLKLTGITVVRFTNEDVLNNIDAVLKRITSICHDLANKKSQF